MENWEKKPWLPTTVLLSASSLLAETQGLKIKKNRLRNGVGVYNTQFVTL